MVFCKECKWLTRGDKCENKNNIKIVNTWYEQREIYNEFPSTINKYNSCEWFERKK